MTPEEKAAMYNVPVIHKPESEPAPPAAPVHKIVAICGECSRELWENMAYNCDVAGCPTGLGTTGMLTK